MCRISVISALLVLLCLLPAVTPQGPDFLDSGGGRDVDIGDMFGSLFSLFTNEDFGGMFGGSFGPPKTAAATPPAQQSSDADTPAASTIASTSASSSSSGGRGGSGGYASTDDSMAALFSSLFESLGSAMGMAPKASDPVTLPANAPAIDPAIDPASSIPASATNAPASAAPTATAPPSPAAPGSFQKVATNNGDDISNLFNALFNSFGEAMGSTKAMAPSQAGVTVPVDPTSRATADPPAGAAPPAVHALPAFAASMFGMIEEPDPNLAEFSDLGMLIPGLLTPAAAKSSSGSGSGSGGSPSKGPKAIPEFAKQMLSVLGGPDTGIKGLDLGALMGLTAPGAGSPLAGIAQLAGPLLGGGLLGSGGSVLGGLSSSSRAMDPSAMARAEAEAQQSRAVLSKLQEQLDAWDTLFDFPQYDNLLSASGFNITELLEEDHPMLAKLMLLESEMEEHFCTPGHIVTAQKVPTTCSAGSLTVLAKGGECRLLRNGKVACSKPRVSFVHIPPSCAYAHKTSQVITSKECKLTRQFGNVTTGYVNHRPPNTTYYNITQGWDSVPGFLQQTKKDAESALSSLKDSFSRFTSRSSSGGGGGSSSSSSGGGSSSGSSNEGSSRKGSLWERLRQREPLLKSRHAEEAPEDREKESKKESYYHAGLLERLHDRLQQRRDTKSHHSESPSSQREDQDHPASKGHEGDKGEGGHKSLFGKLRERLGGEVDDIKGALAARRPREP